MTMASLSSGWVKFEAYRQPHPISTQLIAINDSEFIKWSLKTPNVIEKYNIIENKWDQCIWIKFPDEMEKISVIGALAFGLFMNDKCNIIGAEKGSQSNHLVWNNENQKFDVQHEFNTISLLHRLIYLKSKQKLLCIGGCDGTQQQTDIVHSFDIDSSKWTKISQVLSNELCYLGAVKSRNDEYIVILGGQ